MLNLERHIFSVLERHFQLQEAIAGHNWRIDLDRGEISFVPDDAKMEILSSQVQLLGIANIVSGTWVWGWNTPAQRIPSKLVTCSENLRLVAVKQNSGRFSTEQPYKLTQENEAQELAIIATGFCQLFTFYACEQEDSNLFWGIERPLGLPERKRTPAILEEVISTGITMFHFRHKDALEEYLGPASSLQERVCEWSIQGDPFQVEFDAFGRITSIVYDR